MSHRLHQGPVVPIGPRSFGGGAGAAPKGDQGWRGRVDISFAVKQSREAMGYRVEDLSLSCSLTGAEITRVEVGADADPARLWTPSANLNLPPRSAISGSRLLQIDPFSSATRENPAVDIEVAQPARGYPELAPQRVPWPMPVVRPRYSASNRSSIFLSQRFFARSRSASNLLRRLLSASKAASSSKEIGLSTVPVCGS
jgi:hypothetical protein